MTVHDLYARTWGEIRGTTGRDHRKLANNTYGRIEDDGSVVIRLHNTDIAVITPATARYNTDGWFTVTTKERINRWMPQGFKVTSEKGVWHVRQYPGWHNVSRFYDGITITDDGVMRPELDDPDEPLRKSLEQYVKLYTDERLAELVKYATDNGTNGDCLYCQMDKRAFGGDHLLYHIAEGYTMLTLAFNAVKASGYWPEIYLGSFYHRGENSPAMRGGGFMGDVIRRSIRKYLKARVLNRGLALPDLELENA